MNLNINNEKIVEVISKILYKQYLENLKETKSAKIVLNKHFPFSGAVNRLEEYTFMIIEDPSKWGFLKTINCPN